MPNKTIIAWANYTVSVVHGCSKPAAVPVEMRELAESVSGPIHPNLLKPNTSVECLSCYAEELSYGRRHWTPKPWLEANEAENVQLHPERFNQFAKVPVKPIHLPPSQREKFFVASMGDLFHRRVPDKFLHQFFEKINATPHIYQLLTKRPERAMNWPGPWPDNVWLGTSCGHNVTKWRIECLRKSKAKVRFISAEPLLSSLMHPYPLNLDGINQVIVGGESGAGFRKMDMAWAREIRDECEKNKVAFFFKQRDSRITEREPWLIEEDGSAWIYRQFPFELTPPFQIDPKTSNREHFTIVSE